jgi:hypothetical protein
VPVIQSFGQPLPDERVPAGLAAPSPR